MGSPRGRDGGWWVGAGWSCGFRADSLFVEVVGGEKKKEKKERGSKVNHKCDKALRGEVNDEITILPFSPACP